MTEETMDYKISLTELPRKSILSVSYKFELPNFFTVPEYSDSYFKLYSPHFELGHATWRFRFESLEEEEEIDTGDWIKKCAACLEMLHSRIPFNCIICRISFLNNEEEEYYVCRKTNVFCTEGDELSMTIYDFTYGNYSYDESDTLTFVCHLISGEPLHVEENSVPLKKDKDLELLSEDLKKLLSKGSHDLILRVGEKEFQVHRDILMSRSEVFESMMSHDMTEKKTGVIDVLDCDPQAMEQFLLYVYSGKVETLNDDNVLGLYYIADKYNVALLKEQCSEFIKKSLSTSIICGTIQLALNHSDDDLLKLATDYFLNHTNEIFPTVEWMSFMKSNLIAANELLIKASEKWKSVKK